MDASGNLFGTTQLGGLNGDGTLFKITDIGNPALLPTVPTVSALDGSYDGMAVAQPLIDEALNAMRSV
jgi:uncharacterized repeat protein (TIGR03803 family)